MAFSSWFSQTYPPAPTFSEDDIPRQNGKVFMVTGGNDGVGLALIKLLYPTGATIYMASRSRSRAKKAISEITSTDPSGTARLKFLHIDLADLPTVHSAAATFSAQEERLDILWNNAGVAVQPFGAKTKQGIEVHMGVNVVAHLLLVKLLLPKLRFAAASSRKNGTRVIWTSSHLMELKAPVGGVNLADVENGGVRDVQVNYGASKAANWMVSHECGRRYGRDGIISVCQNPGNLTTKVWDGQPWWVMCVVNTYLHPPKMGAYTELFAGFSEEITERHQGAYVIPWGRVQEGNPRRDIYTALEEGMGRVLWEWCERKIEGCC
ncbi:NAD(P)-binding Rossmann-fold containing protein [Glarea lozoyensis ATCC 20868]|uniref:NAD(P)-binding Rossmann-fold containing protein n=1 Tax=Glarea lozoyensis (strain ATCC 20868 / MF5171) TaxID=1116229 RepID=S3DBX1_GLAL2|nr:NAD(P)-binding Rossmann-fold containing protein [Glarea lozoyensis ATCC 20868]EPE24158.1 NAD(P)-binding Rossmann-fold containing protein [Glarea lozoyensis ATCC 20868]